jgi:uncharacterized membrane protein YhaH (DUF805 family)
MSFQDAVRTCLQQKYATFSGRARRSEYWFFVLFSFIVQVIASILDAAFHLRYGSTGLIENLASLALLLPGLGVAVRRLHDTDRSGWWVLIGLIPIIGWIVLIVFFVQDSHADNQYGPSPKAVEGGYGAVPPPAPQF